MESQLSWNWRLACSKVTYRTLSCIQYHKYDKYPFQSKSDISRNFSTNKRDGNHTNNEDVDPMFCESCSFHFVRWKVFINLNKCQMKSFLLSFIPLPILAYLSQMTSWKCAFEVKSSIDSVVLQKVLYFYTMHYRVSTRS